MTETPQTQYVRTVDGTNIAYQVVGDGSCDLVYVGPWWGNVDAIRGVPPLARMLRRLASFSRLIIFDKRGTGVSDPVPLDALPTLEEWMDDLRAVLDAVGSQRAALWTQLGGSHLAFLFAASYPDRTSALVIENGSASYRRSSGYPFGLEPEEAAGLIEASVQAWPTASPSQFARPQTSVSWADHSLQADVARYQRACASPATVRATLQMIFDTDIRPVLPSVRAPALVIHNGTVVGPSRDHARFLAQQIRGAKFIGLAETDANQYEMDRSLLLDEAEEFITGNRPAPDTDRVLATVLYTDFVDSTPHAAMVGDRAWRDLLDKHDELVRRELDRFRGKWVKHTGDGILATFDGPARGIRCAEAIRDAVRPLGIEVRAGLHAGEVELRGDDIGGIAVHIGQRVSALAGPGEVVVSSTVVDLVAGSGLEFDDRGEHELKGVPRAWRVYAVRP